MQTVLVRRPGIGKGRPSRISRARGLAFGTYFFAVALAGPASAQSLRDYAEDLDAPYLGAPVGDTGILEKRIHDLSFKVRELSEHLQRQREIAHPLHVQPRPLRFTLLERDRPPPPPKTYGEALPGLIRERARAIREKSA